MTNEQFKVRVDNALWLAQQYEWRRLKEFLYSMRDELNETPADIKWDENRINMIGRNGNNGEHYER